MARCFFGPMRAFFAWTSAPQWVRDGEPEARRSSRIFWMPCDFQCAGQPLVLDLGAPVDARNTIVLPARQRHTVGWTSIKPSGYSTTSTYSCTRLLGCRRSTYRPKHDILFSGNATSELGTYKFVIPGFRCPPSSYLKCPVLSLVLLRLFLVLSVTQCRRSAPERAGRSRLFLQLLRTDGQVWLAALRFADVAPAPRSHARRRPA